MFTIAKLLTALLLAGSIALADNVPTIHQVYQTAQAGHLDDAHQMVEEVLKAHPESAKAHYVDAEILVRQGNLANARSELATAEKLAPGLPFAKPDAVKNIKQRISENNQNEIINTIASEATPSNEKPFPWMMLIIGVGALILIVLVFKSFFSRKTDAYPSQGNGGYDTPSAQRYPNTNAPFNPSGSGGGQGYPAQNSGGIGSNIASGLATGAAAGVGIVAGEALMHHFMDDSSSGRGNENVNNSSFTNNNVQPSNTMDDPDFGVTDSSSWDNDSFGDSSDDTW